MTAAIASTTRPPGSFTAAAAPASTAAVPQWPVRARANAEHARPSISTSLWAAPRPCVISTGLATTSQVATFGSTRQALASRGMAQAISTKPSTARRRCASISTYGSMVSRAASPPYASGSGPYGAGVAIHIGSTASTTWPDRTPGPTRYGSKPLGDECTLGGVAPGIPAEQWRDEQQRRTPPGDHGRQPAPSRRQRHPGRPRARPTPSGQARPTMRASPVIRPARWRAGRRRSAVMPPKRIPAPRTSPVRRPPPHTTPPVHGSTPTAHALTRR